MSIAHFADKSMTKKQRKNNMKRGTKVRLLRDNSIGTITDSTFFKLNGQKHIRYEVKKNGVKEKHWYPDEELGPVVEHCKVTLEGERGQVLFANISFDHNKREVDITITGNHPHNLKEHHGYHLKALVFMLKGMEAKVKYTGIESD